MLKLYQHSIDKNQHSCCENYSCTFTFQNTYLYTYFEYSIWIFWQIYWCTWEFRKRNSENYIRVRASSKRFVEVSIYAKKYITLQDIFATFQGWRDYIIRSFRWYNDKHVFIERKPIKHYYYLLLSIMYFCLYCPMRMLTCFEICWFEDLKII